MLAVSISQHKDWVPRAGSLHTTSRPRSSPASIAFSIAAQNAASIFSSSARMRISSRANSSCIALECKKTAFCSLRDLRSTLLPRKHVHQVEASRADSEDDCHVRQGHEHQSRT